MKQLLLFSSLFVLMSGCSSTLQVDIQVLKRSYLRENPQPLFEILDEKDSDLRASQELFSLEKENLQQQVEAYIRSNSCLFDTLHPNRSTPSQADRIIENANSNINRYFTAASNNITKGLQKKDTIAFVNVSEQAKLLLQARSLFQQGIFRSHKSTSINFRHNQI